MGNLTAMPACGLLAITVILIASASAAPDDTRAAQPGQQAGAGKPVLTDASGSDLGVDYFAQGGVVVDGIGYFLADHGFSKHLKAEGFPYGVAFDVRTFRKIRTYPFEDTYDSSPLIIQRLDGSWLVLAHEHQRERTVALDRDTGEVAWVSPENQPGSYFFGYSYYVREDGGKVLLAASTNGLHALSAETGEELWWVQARSTGGVTPCVDQSAGIVYYQLDGQVMKVRASDGAVLASVSADHPCTTVSWNTVLVDDAHGKYVATYWFGFEGGQGPKQMQWNAAIRVYDADLHLVWERTGLPGPKKSTLTYADGKLVIGTGGHWAGEYEGEAWKYIDAYDVSTGDVVWRCDLRGQDFTFIMNVPYAWGSFYAEASGGNGRLFRIDGATGALLEVLDYDAPVSSCAPCIIAHGMMLSGDLTRDGVVVTRLAENSHADWPGPFGDPQTNTYALREEPEARSVPMAELRPGAESHAE